MKRFLCILIVGLSIAITSCNKDENDNNLIGSNWIVYYEWGTYTYNFKDKDTCIETYYSENPTQIERTYKQTGNKIEIFTTGNKDKSYATATISGNKMILIVYVFSGQQMSIELVRE